MNKFKLVTSFFPQGDQPKAIEGLYKHISAGNQHQTLLGATGSGKTFTLACLIEKLNRPVLVISHNKTLAAQLYSEFKQFFPENAVEYFVSYYDYYQPESYIPQTDTYIEKDASINDRLDRLRLSATSSLVSRRDTIVVASVSSIYNLGSPSDYQNLILSLETNQVINQEDLIHNLLSLQYERNDYDFKRASFRVKGDTIDIFPAYKETGLRIQFFGDEIEKIFEIDPLTAKKNIELEKIGLYPAKHFIMGQDRVEKAIGTIKKDLEEHLQFLESNGKLLEAQRLKSRTLYDLEMLKEMGWCHGIENYSRYFTDRPQGSRPYCLIDYFDSDFLTIIDESHVTIPQIRGMFAGDKSRKETLIEYGFRLPSCLDNRPLKAQEFFDLIGQTIFVSATPADFEKELTADYTVEQIIRPTGLVDPEIEIRSTVGQVEDLFNEIEKRIKNHQRTIITTLTKRMSEELSLYLKNKGIKVTYLHSDLDAIKRAHILRQLRLKEFDCVVGINLLREGIDLPEVSLVAILDADREGFLRSTTSLVQIAGRCARNVDGKVIMYADKITNSMKNAIYESGRRRKLQLKYNQKNSITPKTVTKNIQDGIERFMNEEEKINQRLDLDEVELEMIQAISFLEKDMRLAAKNLQFEKAAKIRDRIKELQEALKK